jgi:hypothetical protein
LTLTRFPALTQKAKEKQTKVLAVH